MVDKSVVYWYSNPDRHLCGYCKNEKGNISHGMWAKYLTVEDYQNLIDRGWRRSGNYCYKPLMEQICCPMYTIKCDALNFQISKSQKKVIKKFNKFLKDGILNKSANHKGLLENSDNIPDFFCRDAPKHLTLEHPINSDLVVESDEAVSFPNDVQCTSQIKPSNSLVKNEPSEPIKETKPEPKNGLGADPNKPPCKKAKVLRLERKKEKLLKRGMSLEKIEIKNEHKSLEDFLNDVPQDGKHKLKLELINTGSQSKEWERLKKVEFALYRKYQMAVHNDPPEKCKMESFLRFLVNSPLQHVKFTRDSELGFGSFHQLYWLDGKLIAVGVIDILPKCVSAVYFFYDPDYRDLTLGTYGSLREVEFVKSLHQKMPAIDNYYMGFYIHSCPKMRYKGKLTPSYLLCPETYRWISIERCLEKLEVSKYSKLNEDESTTDENKCSSRDVDEMKILQKGKLVLFRQYKRKYGGQEIFATIGQLIGQKCSKSIIFIGDNLE